MKKLYYLIVIALISSLVLTGCLLSNVGQVPTNEQSGISYLTKNGSLPNLVNLVGLWHFSENLTDSSGNNNHGTFFGVAETYVDSPMGQALSFDGVNDYVSVLDSSSLDDIIDLTVELWLNPTITYDTGAADYYVFVSKFGPKSFQFVYHPAGYLYLYVTGGMAVRSYNLTLNSGTWYHLAATFNSGTGNSHIYVDYEDVTLSTTIQTMTENDSPLLIGARPSPSPTYPKHFVMGTIDEVRIWNIALPLEQLGSIIYDWDGFFPPINDLPTFNLVKAGRAIPVKFSLNGDKGLEIFDDYPKSIPISCPGTSNSIGEMEFTETADESRLNYDVNADQYIFVWKTNKVWAGTCRRLEVKLKDGTSHFADFKFK